MAFPTNIPIEKTLVVWLKDIVSMNESLAGHINVVPGDRIDLIIDIETSWLNNTQNKVFQYFITHEARIGFNYNLSKVDEFRNDIDPFALSQLQNKTLATTASAGDTNIIIGIAEASAAEGIPPYSLIQFGEGKKIHRIIGSSRIPTLDLSLTLDTPLTEDVSNQVRYKLDNLVGRFILTREPEVIMSTTLVSDEGLNYTANKYKLSMKEQPL